MKARAYSICVILFLAMLILFQTSSCVHARGRVLIIQGWAPAGAVARTLATNQVIMNILQANGIDFMIVPGLDSVRIDFIRQNLGTVVTGGAYPGDYRFDLTIVLGLYPLLIDTGSFGSDALMRQNNQIADLNNYTNRLASASVFWNGRILMPIPERIAVGGVWDFARTGCKAGTTTSGTPAYGLQWWKWERGRSDSLEAMIQTVACAQCWVPDERDTTGVTGVRRLVWYDSDVTEHQASRLARAWYTYKSGTNHGVYWVTNSFQPESYWILQSVIAGECNIERPIPLYFAMEMVYVPPSYTTALWGTSGDTTNVSANVAALVRDVLVPYNMKLELFWSPWWVYNSNDQAGWPDLRTLFYNLSIAYPKNIRLVLNSQWGNWNGSTPAAIMSNGITYANSTNLRETSLRAQLANYYPLLEHNTINLYGGTMVDSWSQLDSMINILYDKGYRYVIGLPTTLSRQTSLAGQSIGLKRIYSSNGKSLLVVPTGPEAKYLTYSSGEGGGWYSVNAASDTARMAYCCGTGRTKQITLNTPRLGNVMRVAWSHVFSATTDASGSTTLSTNPLAVAPYVWAPSGTLRMTLAMMTGGNAYGAGYPTRSLTQSTNRSIMLTFGKYMVAAQYISTTYGQKKNVPFQCLFSDEWGPWETTLKPLSL